MARPNRPTALKVIEGNRGKRPLNDKEPKPPNGVPDKPLHLSTYAVEMWEHITPILMKMGVLTIADGAALESLCEAYSDARTARDYIAIHGRYFRVKLPRGGGHARRTHPAVADLADADRRFRGWLSEFGLTPSTRSKIVVDPSSGDDDGVGEFFGR